MIGAGFSRAVNLPPIQEKTMDVIVEGETYSQTDQPQQSQRQDTRSEQPVQSQQQPGTNTPPVPSSVAGIEARLAALTGPESRYTKLAMTDPKDAQRKVELDEISRLRDALEGYKARTTKTPASKEHTEEPELREPLAEPLTEMLPNPPEGWSQPDEVAARSLGAELGVPSGMMNDALNAIARGGRESQFNSYDEAVTAAQAKFGDDYTARIEHANLALKTAGPELTDLIRKTGAGDNLALIEWLSDLGQRMVEAEAEINKLRDDPAYKSASHPEHRLAQAEMARLMAIRYPLKRA
jgi:hypothetical protein